MIVKIAYLSLIELVCSYDCAFLNYVGDASGTLSKNIYIAPAKIGFFPRIIAERSCTPFDTDE